MKSSAKDRPTRPTLRKTKPGPKETVHFETSTANLIARCAASDQWNDPEVSANRKVMLQTRDIVRKVRTWQQRLGILDYEVIFKAGTDTPDGIHARIWVSHDYKYADITLADGWEYIYEQVIEQKIVHELLHIIWHRARRAFEATEIHLGHLAYSAFFTSFESAEETAVESLAAALVDGWGLA